MKLEHPGLSTEQTTLPGKPKLYKLIETITSLNLYLKACTPTVHENALEFPFHPEALCFFLCAHEPRLILALLGELQFDTLFLHSQEEEEKELVSVGIHGFLCPS